VDDVSSLVALAIAKPVPKLKAGGMAIPLARHSSLLNSKSNKSMDFDAIRYHGISVREKIFRGLENYEMNTGTMHPFAVKRSESELGTRGAGVPLTTTSHQSNMWKGEISIGTPPKVLKVHIDTGAADMWILGPGCEGISADRDLNLWDPWSSESARWTGRSFQLEYSDGTMVKGYRYTDNVTIAGFTVDPQMVGSVSMYTSKLQNNGYADGLLGLAFPSISKFGADPLFASLVSQKRLIDPTISFKLSSSGAEMYVGGANRMLYNGDITYTPVTVQGFWQVSMDDVRINGNKIFENVPVMFDTGAEYIYGDWERVSELYRRLDGTLDERHGEGYYHLPCDSFPTVSLTFGGRSFEIPPEVLRLKPIDEGSPNCFGAIIGQRSPVAYWNIGITFLQGVYSVFDYGALPQVGFADLA